MKKQSLVILISLISFTIICFVFYFLHRSYNVPSEVNAQDYEYVCTMIKALDDQKKDRPKDLKNKEWVTERLEKMVNFDQAIRKVSNVLFDQKEIYSLVQKINTANAQELKEILKHYYWITISEFGKEADHNAWLLTQHQDNDTEFQEEILLRLKNLYPKGDTDPSHYAYLYDRIAIAKGKPQLYGTQGSLIENKWQPGPIEDEANIDERRKKMKMPSYHEYIELINKAYNLKPRS